MQEKTVPNNGVKAGVVCGVIGVVSAVWTYWLVVPGLLFGLAALVLGWRGRRGGEHEYANVAIALGVVAMLLVPSVIAIANSAEDWGRGCALDPSSDENC